MKIRSKFAGKGALAVAVLAGGAVAATAFAPSPAMAQKKYFVKIGMATINDPQHIWGKWIGEEMKKRSGGRLTFQTFPASQLGKIPRQVEGIQLGTQEMFLTPPGFFVGVNQAFMVPDAPGFFRDAIHAHKTLTDPAFRNKFLSMGENKGVIGNGISIYDGTSYATLKPMKNLADMKGRKIRVLATPMERAVPAQFGATGVPIPFTEVVPALQRSVVDGARTSLVVMAYTKFQTVTKFLTVVNDGYIPSASWVSKVWLSKLPKDLQKIVLDVAGELEDKASENARNNVDAMVKVWKEAGATVSKFSPEDQKTYMAKVRPLGDKFLGQHKNPQVREMYALMKQVAARH